MSTRPTAAATSSNAIGASPPSIPAPIRQTRPASPHPGGSPFSRRDPWLLALAAPICIDNQYKNHRLTLVRWNLIIIGRNSCRCVKGSAFACFRHAARRNGHGADRDQVRPCRRARLVARKERFGICQTRQCQARRQGQGRGLRVEPTRQRFRNDEEAEARNHRPGAAVDGDVVLRAQLRSVRNAVSGEGPRPHGAHSRPDRLSDHGAAGREGRLSHHRRVGERLPPDHQQQAPDRQAGGSARHQAAYAEGRMAREDVQGLRRQPDAARFLRGFRRAARQAPWTGRKIRWRRSIPATSRKCRSSCR